MTNADYDAILSLKKKGVRFDEKLSNSLRISEVTLVAHLIYSRYQLYQKRACGDVALFCEDARYGY